jgi:negative regulator of flagellin synthesis FlgM
MGVKMKISDMNKQADLLARLNQVNGSKQAEKVSSPPEATPPSSSSDKVELSPRSKDIKKIYETIEKAPDIREERVNAIKELIQKDQYEVKSDKVASKMVDEFLSEFTR